MASGQACGPARAAGRLGLLVSRFGDWLFRADDARARQHGWQITVHQGGLARAYRDPRFGRFSRCPACDGIGTSPGGDPCSPCTGTGRITVTGRSVTDRGLGQ
jgi:hypothetical protein